MGDAFHALLGFTLFNPLKQSHLANSVHNMRNVLGALSCLPSLATGAPVPPVSISLTATIKKPA